MIWLLKDFDLLSVLLRAATLSFEALVVGGVLFLWLMPPALSRTPVRRLATGFALALALSQLLSISVETAMLMGGAGESLRDALTANFFVAGSSLVAAAILLFVFLRLGIRGERAVALLLAAAVLAASVAQSHAASRLQDRALLLALTAAHHLGTAAWIGGMPYLLLCLRSKDEKTLQTLLRRFSAVAVISVVLLAGAGFAMSIFYVGSWSGLYGTSYGVMILAKSYLLVLILFLGALNFFAVRAAWPPEAASPLLLRLRRFTEVELALGFTAILAAASLTSQPPAVDLTQDRLTRQDIVERVHWQWPRMHSPPVLALAPPTPLKRALQESLYTGGVENDANDRAWSEYNHHWAGMIVLCAGLFAMAAQLQRKRSPPYGCQQHRLGFANWPLLFLGLSIFILLRADPENWPLGPRPFWASFAQPDVLEHRLYALLIAGFAFFEWSVETGRVASRRAALVFPLLCAAGGALLITHNHALGNVRDEMFAEMAHTPIALLGATAGWGRWLELRLPGRRESRIAGWVWPVCLVLVGIILLDYRES